METGTPASSSYSSHRLSSTFSSKSISNDAPLSTPLAAHFPRKWNFVNSSPRQSRPKSAEGLLEEAVNTTGSIDLFFDLGSAGMNEAECSFCRECRSITP